MAVSIKDVAKEAGVSATTVSKVLNHSPSIPEVTAEKIRLIMNQMDYHPNVRAQNFARKSTRTIVFATKLEKNYAFENPHMFEIMLGVQNVLESKKYALHLVNVTKDNCMDVLGNMIAQKSIDGLVLHISCISKELEKVIMKEQFPHIVLGCPEYRTQLCWIDNNNILSGEMAANYMLERGYQKIGFLGGYKSDIGSACRLQGYYNSMEQKKIVVNQKYIELGESSIENGAQMMNRLLHKQERVDAVICANNNLALGAMRAAVANGLRVPMDIAVITFDIYPFTKTTSPKITTVDIDVYDMGKQAGEIILRKIRKPNLQIQSYTTLASLIVNGST